MPWQGWLLIFLIIPFIMIAVLIVVYQRSKPSSPKLQEGDRGFERENKIFTLYQNLEDMMDGFDKYIEETRAEFESERIELMRQREEIARMHANIMAITNRLEQRAGEIPQAIPDAIGTPEPETSSSQAPRRFAGSMRHAQVEVLYEQGKNVEEIAKELRIARSEAALTLRMLGKDDAEKPPVKPAVNE